MLRTLVTRSTLVALACSLLICTQVFADSPSEFDVPAGELDAALKSLAKQADVELVYQPEQVRDVHTEGLKGNYSAQEAVIVLLKGTRLQVHTDSSGAMVIAPVMPAEKSTALGLEENGSKMELAQVVSSGSQSTESSGQGTGEKMERLEEIVVTAQKRTERLQDVPVPVTALNAQSLLAGNQVRIEDYYVRIPGVNISPDAFRGSAGTIIIRGLQSGGGNPTVSVVLDDVPYGSSTALGGGGSVPDIDPNDLARVEVLRGPQSTLYGVSSLAGLIKYVTVDPSTDRVSGRVRLGVNATKNGDDPGYDVRASVNIPVSDTFAIKASGFTRRDAGYVDDRVNDIQGLNELEVSGGRLSALWKPTENLSLRLSALMQDNDRKGLSRIDLGPSFGDLEQAPSLPGTGKYHGKTQAYSMTLSANVLGGELVSLSGYNVNKYSDDLDLSGLYGFYTNLIAPGVTNTLLTDHNKTDKFTQELRLTLPLSSSLDWLVGAFYTHEKSDFLTEFYATDDAGNPTVFAESNAYPTKFREYALFTDLTWKINDRLDIQFGGRQSKNQQRYENTITGPYTPIFFGRPSPLINGETKTSDSSFTYLVTPRFRISPDLMVYTRLASGYRAGGPNFLGTAFGVPREFKPDKTRNYEIGMKGNALDRMLSFDASIYYIDWDNIAISVFDQGFSFTDNASGAESKGVELALELRPLTGLTISTAASLNKAVLTGPFPATSLSYGQKGDRLPRTGKFSGNLTIDQTFPLGPNVTGMVGGSFSYVGKRAGDFTSAFTTDHERVSLPSYAQTDLHAGVRYESWDVSLFLNNVTDKRGVLSPDLFFPSTAVYYIRPRTLGLSLTREF
jgi:outer membrane receptor protein involved in Fe transport